MIQIIRLNEIIIKCAIKILNRNFLIENTGYRHLGKSEECTHYVVSSYDFTLTPFLRVSRKRSM